MLEILNLVALVVGYILLIVASYCAIAIVCMIIYTSITKNFLIEMGDERFELWLDNIKYKRSEYKAKKMREFQ
ncbi:hypothetical protein GZ989_003855 [Campylobacter fetus]|uniref:hypothetical protein n=1 Tax=Campylobacter fetus TaxID=196 RepID=UPI0003D8500F|nr:hypothetical protein [Campylobacter fetus]OCS21888.1 hypothetical protein CFVI97532_07195 [Campylobacter fetus subsp. venerealis cfvi97/532]OCS43094.1 hypothetical protein CFVI02298_01220 [Campylobacter fetus subsp. venerealis cfvi02/298]AHE94383.1 hypothetical protein CFVI03293_1078 [Campylobacter fetus subsp. venerealis cfvi03/293]EAI3887234.1 hypothetical protein [Campylobacter fetus]KAA3684572.1 hypothetical protein E3U40_06275 [Campylobacter fetus subsp. venerealis]